MKKLLVVIAFPLLISADTYVYICKGPSAKRYLYIENCQGLSNCSTPIYKVAKTQAREAGRTLCGWED